MDDANRNRQISSLRDVTWDDASSSTNLPVGIRVGRMSELAGTGIRNVLVSFTPGYFEPRHTHGIAHATFLLEGRWIVEGKEIGPGGYIFGPAGLPHGPFESPEGSLVFGSDAGTDFWHKHPPTEDDEDRAVPTVIVERSWVSWSAIPDGLDLASGGRMKAYNTVNRTGRRDGLLEFPPGAVSSGVAASDSYRSMTLLEGDLSLDGRELGARGHVFAPPGVSYGNLTTERGAVLCFTSVRSW